MKIIPRLSKIRITNYRSIDDITLNFRDLTIIVGGNSSGKSNCLEAIFHISTLVEFGKAAPINFLQEARKIGSNNNPSFGVTIKAKKDVQYNVEILAKYNEPLDTPVILHEDLKVGRIEIIAVKEGKGEVRDEDNNNIQSYHSKSDTLALTSVGNFGNKPVSLSIRDFIGAWRIYDLEPDFIRGYETYPTNIQSVSLNIRGDTLQSVLTNLAKNDVEIFQIVNEEIKRYLNLSLHWEPKNNEYTYTLEVGDLKIPFKSLSDGTVRIITYCVLLHLRDISPFIGIEEPERNLHPGILQGLASILVRLSKRTQVVITTHSSQLLDCFKAEDIYSDISLILLKKTISGTKAYNADELGSEALSDWMSDFGIGSAIFHSNLLDEILDKE
jgi:predicted ATPase